MTHSNINANTLAKLLIKNPEEKLIKDLYPMLTGEDITNINSEIYRIRSQSVKGWDSEEADSAMKVVGMFSQKRAENEDEFGKALAEIEEPEGGWPKSSDMDKL